MIFIENKYTCLYYKIIDRAMLRFKTAGYTENHHIIPKSFFKHTNGTGWLDGNPNISSNLVSLTAKEHFICHKLLTQMTSGLALNKTRYAFRAMCNVKTMSQQRHVATSSDYKFLRENQPVVSKETRIKMSKPKSAEHRASMSKPKSAEHRAKMRLGQQNRSDETRFKMSAAQKGKVVSKETRNKISAAKQNISKETRNKMSIAAKNRPSISNETRDKISTAKKGKLKSANTRTKMCLAQKGRIVSAETRAKLSVSNLGKKASDETKAKIGAASKGRVVSEETRAKMKANHKGGRQKLS